MKTISYVQNDQKPWKEGNQWKGSFADMTLHLKNDVKDAPDQYRMRIYASGNLNPIFDYDVPTKLP